MIARGQIRDDPAAASHVIAGLLEMHAGAPTTRSNLAGVLPAGVIARHLAERFDIPLSDGAARRDGVAADASRRNAHLLLLKCVLDDDRSAIEGFVSDIKERHIPFTAIYRQLISPAMNVLGEMWSDDEADFVTVTIATSRMQSMVHELTDYGPSPDGPATRRKRILFTRPEGEQHTLGLATVIACFSHGGWAADGGIDLTAGHGLRNILGARHYDVLGISLGAATTAGDVKGVIADARRWSVNSELKVALGGPLVALDPDAVGNAGADFCSPDAVHALEIANDLTRNAGSLAQI